MNMAVKDELWVLLGCVCISLHTDCGFCEYVYLFPLYLLM